MVPLGRCTPGEENLRFAGCQNELERALKRLEFGIEMVGSSHASLGWARWSPMSCRVRRNDDDDYRLRGTRI